MKQRKIKFEFIIDDKIISNSYTIEELLEIDNEKILEDMEVCTCTLNESVNHCECDSRFDNSTITGRREYTGLHDKNGNEIYEGDILKKDGSMSIYKAEIGMHWIRGFQQYGFHLKVNYNPDSIGFSNLEFDLSVLEGIEVIGNIYENPELVKIK